MKDKKGVFNPYMKKFLFQNVLRAEGFLAVYFL